MDKVLHQIPKQEPVNEETISLNSNTFHGQIASESVKQTVQISVGKSSEKGITATEHICNICQKQYKNRKTLQQHQNIHTGKHKCQKCNAPFMSMSKLKSHYRDPNNCLTIQEIRSWKNVIANKFSENDARKEKEPQPEVGKNCFQCPECPNQYNKKNSLMVHRVMHTGKYKCQKCKETFQSRSKLKKHINNPNSCLILKKIRASRNVIGLRLQRHNPGGHLILHRTRIPPHG